MTDSELKRMIGNNIKKYREEANLTQEELAKKLGLKHKTSISKLETGIDLPREQKLRRIAEALGCSFGDLMGWKPSKYGHYTLLIRAYEDAPEHIRQSVCMSLNIPYLEIEKSANMA